MLACRDMRRRFLLTALLLFATAACGDPEPARPPVSAKRSASPEPPKPVFCPLTGEETSQSFPKDKPALGVKIENSVAARPQAGLDKADIVYEELAEGGITRFLAIFHCDEASSLGPIRSARLVDPDIMLEYKPALFAYSGGNPLVKDKITATKGLVDLRHGSHGDGYSRERGRKAPHNLFSSTERLRGLEDARELKGTPKSPFVFDVNVSGTPSPTAKPTTKSSPAKAKASPTAAISSPTAPPPGTTVSFSYSGTGNVVRYVYDAGAKAYLRSHGEQPHRGVSGEQFRADNVVVLKVRVTQGTIRDSAGNFSPEITVTGSGEVVVLRGGLSVNGKWARSGLSDQTKLTDASGKPIKLVPGKTWIHLVPTDRPINVQ